MFDVNSKIKYSLFSSVVSTEPLSQERTLQEMADFFTPHFPLEVEKAARKELFSMNVYQENAKRGIKGIAAMTGLVFDFDNKNEFVPIAQVVKILDQKKIIHFWYTTHSHTVERPKWRLVIPFARFLAVEEWNDVYDRAVILIGSPPGIDHSASKDMAHMWFIPYKHPDHGFMGESRREGWMLEPLDLDLLLTYEEKKKFQLRKEQEEKQESLSFGEKSDFTLEEAKHNLLYIDSGCPYEQWIRVGMALHYQFGDRGFDLWRRWSSTWKKYPGAKLLQTLWSSFKEENREKKVTIATLIHYAKQNPRYTSWPGNPTPVFEICPAEMADIPDDTTDPFSVFSLYENVDIYNFPSPLLTETYAYLLKRHQYDVPLYAMGASIALSGFLMRNRIQSLTRLRTNFMILAIGGSGTGKTMIRNGVLEILKYVNQDSFYAQRLGSYQGSVERLEKNKGCLFLVQDEARFELKSSRSSSVSNSEMRIEEFKLTLFSSPPFYSGDVIKGSEPKLIENPFFAEFSISTPDMLKSFSPDDVTKGLLPRYLLFTTGQHFFKENKYLTYEMATPFKVLLEDLKKGEGYVPQDALLSQEAFVCLEGFKNHVQTCREKILESSVLNNNARFDAVLARLPEHAVKLSLLGATSNFTGYEISSNAMLWGIGVALFSFKNLVHTIQHNLYENKTEEYHYRVLEIIRYLSKGKWVKRRVILRAARFLRVRELDDTLNRLRDEEMIEIKQEKANVFLIRSVERGKKK